MRLENLESLAPRGNAESATSVPDVCSHCVRREHEQLGDLSGCQSLAVEAEDRRLAWSQTLRRPRPPLRLRSAEPSGGSGCEELRAPLDCREGVAESRCGRVQEHHVTIGQPSLGARADRQRADRDVTGSEPTDFDRVEPQRSEEGERPTAIVSGLSAGIGSSARRRISLGRRPLAATSGLGVFVEQSDRRHVDGSAGTRASVTC